MEGAIWTKQQQEVIDARNQNLLVSAAAGSGKTAVMVERILSMVSDERHPVDIDRLLVVTFTNAAAQEMKERILNGLEEKAEKEPANQHILRQIARVQKAQITTIHSFCLRLIREHFMEIDIDPAFRIGEEGEMGLLHQDALAEVLEEAYGKKEEDFLAFLESYATGKSDQNIEDMILKAYTFARSGKNPKQWLKKNLEVFSLSEEEIFNSSWMQYLEKDIMADVKKVLEVYDELYKQIQTPLIPDGHKQGISKEYESLQDLRESKDLKECMQAAKKWEKAKITSRAGKAHDKILVKNIMDARKQAQDMLDKILGRLPSSPSQIEKELKQCKKPMSGFITLILRFMEIVEAKKKHKNIVDFSDLEQHALQILSDGEEDGKLRPSKIALEKKEFFTEIYVDEYQDTNEIQEEILRLISGEAIGKHNLFVVGDLKQSIYGFRQAKPELFIRRYESYRQSGEQHRLIELQKNFRSRPQVLDTTNYLFYRLMGKELGGIPYDENVALFTGKEFPTLGMDAKAEFHVFRLEEETANLTAIEAEARMIGCRIKQMVGMNNPQMVTQVEKDGSVSLRKAQYRDIVILLRTVSGWGEGIQEELEKMGIPAFCESKKGSFTAIEVQTMMSVLKVLDNERQDIPFLAFLRAPFIGVTGEEMVWLTSIEWEEEGIHDLCDFVDAYLQEEKTEENASLYIKLEKAKNLIEKYREKKKYLSIAHLIWEFLEETGYYHLVGAMPQGERRQANLEMLIQKSKTFEQSNYRGLFRFVRYMQQLKEYDIDYGEANVQGEHENLVRIMSIHKSKGLEYPIVFVSGMGKQFNMQDLKEPILMDAEYGFGTNAISLEKREKRGTILKNAIIQKKKEEILGEELRILYVALTRAKDKLVMTGSAKKFPDTLVKNKSKGKDGKYDYYDIKHAKSYLDWLLLALSKHPCMEDVYRSYFPKEALCLEKGAKEDLKIRIWTLETLLSFEIAEFEKAVYTKEMLLKKVEQESDEKVKKELLKQFSWEYAYEDLSKYKIKYSVSEIKKKSQVLEERMENADTILSMEEASIVEQEAKEEIKEFEPKVPRFLQIQEKTSPTMRGTLIHKFMELLDFTKDYTKESLAKELETWILEEKIDKDVKKAVSIPSILWFLNSSLGKRVKNAALEGNIYKEQQFVLGLPLKEVEKSSKSEELAVVQGIVDLYLIEDGEIILLDYKSDYAKKGEEEVLVRRYEKQIKSYRRALEQMTGKKVKEAYLSSLSLWKNIRMGT